MPVATATRMDVSVSRADLLSAFQLCAAVVEKRSTIPILSNLKLTAAAGRLHIVAADLDVTAKIPGADKGAFDTAANNAKAGCPVSRVLNAAITMNATLEA